MNYEEKYKVLVNFIKFMESNVNDIDISAFAYKLGVKDAFNIMSNKIKELEKKDFK